MKLPFKGSEITRSVNVLLALKSIPAARAQCVHYLTSEYVPSFHYGVNKLGMVSFFVSYFLLVFLFVNHHVRADE